MVKIGVVLSGCGVYDGAEIHESVITMLALDRLGAEIVCMAPDTDQMHVMNHLTGKPAEGEKRNVLVESARIARGNIRDIAKVKGKDLDGFIVPGGFGAAKNLCNFATAGADCKAHPEVARVLTEAREAGKPIGAICIAPALLARIFGADKPELTIGTDAGTAAAMEKMGACHADHQVDEIHVDESNKMISTPAYMLAQSISQAASGIEKLVKKVVEMAG
ncbi:MAG: isoprenoid biosynthesis glyoxalase ElbB [Planctomycetes bacterium]|nr:isoprenoid biosynthesis glyoxalase ElbB [Planctomycetota bacterium]